MTNLERAREEANIINDQSKKLTLRDQIALSALKAVNETKEPKLWRDLEEGEVYQEGDRILKDKQNWIILSSPSRVEKRSKHDVLAQRRVRKEEL